MWVEVRGSSRWAETWTRRLGLFSALMVVQEESVVMTERSVGEDGSREGGREIEREGGRRGDEKM